MRLRQVHHDQQGGDIFARAGRLRGGRSRKGDRAVLKDVRNELYRPRRRCRLWPSWSIQRDGRSTWPPRRKAREENQARPRAGAEVPQVQWHDPLTGPRRGASRRRSAANYRVGVRYRRHLHRQRPAGARHTTQKISSASATTHRDREGLSELFGRTASPADVIEGDRHGKTGASTPSSSTRATRRAYTRQGLSRRYCDYARSACQALRLAWENPRAAGERHLRQVVDERVDARRPNRAGDRGADARPNATSTPGCRERSRRSPCAASPIPFGQYRATS